MDDLAKHFNTAEEYRQWLKGVKEKRDTRSEEYNAVRRA
jgi:hypothetical protein